jgi:hypothetical protein
MATIPENRNAVSRRSTRIFMEEQVLMEHGITKQNDCEPSNNSGDENEKIKVQPGRVSSTTSTQFGAMQTVDVGRDLNGIFPQTLEDMGKQGTALVSSIHSNCG